MSDPPNNMWYKDAIVYQLHVKAFFDSNGDGVGDFTGLAEKLDYIEALGATAIWLMPFYPSPLKDDGYDISDYRGINPSYGTMRDFRRVVREAHARGLRVITELVINHTSDQHRWFQKARLAPKGSNARNFYVWSDTPDQYQGARIIFLDTEVSNWSWDPVAKAYYWHRFYSHQPDLNFDNPRVLDTVIETMRYWLDMGVDGLRLDAIPYLIERNGTTCENLPETHDIIRRIRAALDESHPDRMLLAEANQWPEETAQYFGVGDECHMAFHFPLMPRMYMAIAMEDRHPITDILRQTPEIPDSAQWAIFLRNHDELTLEMVTDKERDYLWSFYASDHRARINLGIRRRLAPLLENDRRKTELLSSLLFTMPGTPVLYYGDEIGMGDNIYLGDRDGVRTPMQWSPDRNGGFSRADPARLYLPAIQDPIYGFASVNVESQQQNSASLLNWTRRMIAVRRRYRPLSRGALRFIYPENRKILAYVREYQGQQILCVANVSRAPQAAELDLSEFRGATPLELTGGAAFPQIGSLPYMLTLSGYGFYWFLLDTNTSTDTRFGPAPAPELFTLVLTGQAGTLLQGREVLAFERTIAPRFLMARRWFAGANTGSLHVHVETLAALPPVEATAPTYIFTILNVKANEFSQIYFAPLAVDENGEEETILPYAIARVRRGARMGLMYDADADKRFGAVVMQLMQSQRTLPSPSGGCLRFLGTDALANIPSNWVESRRLGGDQSNSTLVIDDLAVLKLYRRVQEGVNPEIEMSRFLSEQAKFDGAPSYLGAIEHVDQAGSVTALGVLHTFVRNQGDAWARALDAFKLAFEELLTPPAGQEPPLAQVFSSYAPHVRALGRRTAQLHAALATPTQDEAFRVEPYGERDLAAARTELQTSADRAISVMSSLQSDRPGESSHRAESLIKRRDDLDATILRLTEGVIDTFKFRVHGDYHLGQILLTQRDVMIVDFEGEPSRPLHERRAKDTPLRDVAGMLRSISYAGQSAMLALGQRIPTDRTRADHLASEGVDFVSSVFLESYEAEVAGTRAQIVDSETRARLLRLKLLSKALYEINYESEFRPQWISFPVLGVLSLLDETSTL